MKILLVSSSSSGSGGGELFFLKLAKRFIAHGEYVSIAYSADSLFDGLAKQASDIGCEVIRFPYKRVYDRPFRSLELFLGGKARGISKIGIDSYDVVHVSQQNIEDGIDLVAAIGRICPERLVVTIHIVDRLRHLDQHLGDLRQIYPKWVYRSLQNKVRFAFVSTSAERLFSELFGVRLRFSRIIHNGAENPLVPLASAAPREALGIDLSDFVVGSVGRLEKQKNYKLLIRAFAEAKAVIGNLRLVLVGDGSQRHELIELAKSLEVEKSVTVTGWIPDPERFLDIMDVFVLSSWYEGFPFALVEALQREKVCLASSIAPHVECLAEETPLLFNPESYGELRDALKLVAFGDERLLKAAGRAIDNARSKFKMNTMIEEMISLYRLPVEKY